jgi:hypothetical protein
MINRRWKFCVAILGLAVCGSATVQEDNSFVGDDTSKVLELFRKSVESSNRADSDEYISIASDDLKRVWLLDASKMSFAPINVAKEFRRHFENDDDLSHSYAQYVKNYVHQTEELEDYDLDKEYCEKHPGDLILKHYGAGYARISAYLLKFEFVDRQLLYTLRCYGTLPRLYYESEPTKVEISGDDAVVFAKARMPKKFFGTVSGNLDTVTIEPIPVDFKKIDGAWKLSPFQPPVQK